MIAMDNEPFWSGRRLATAASIAMVGAQALVGVRPIYPDASGYVDAAYRILCLIAAIGTAWWLYRGGGVARPWLSQEAADRIGLWVERLSVAVALLALLLFVALAVVWWVTRP